MLHKHFYIICRDGQILEVENKQETLEAVSSAMINKGLVVLKEYGSMLNGVDISKVLKEDAYDAWVSSTNPKEYIKNGIWRDGKEKGIIRYEKWKQGEIDAQLKLDKPKEKELTPEEQDGYRLYMKEKFNKFRPVWMAKQEIIPPHDPELTAKRKSITETKDIDY